MKQSVFYLSLFIAIMQLATTSCSKKSLGIEEAVTAFPEFYSGVIYNYCDPDPQFYFSIDSIRMYCSNISLNDMFDTDSLGQNNLKACGYPLGDEKNWDFKIGSHQLEWHETPISTQPVQAKTVYEGGRFPFIHFYGGYEVKISENQALTALFFNGQIGGCIHDYYVWEFVEHQ